MVIQNLLILLDSGQPVVSQWATIIDWLGFSDLVVLSWSCLIPSLNFVYLSWSELIARLEK